MSALYDLGISFHHCLSLAAHVMFLTAASFATPNLAPSAEDGGSRARDTVEMIRHLLSAAAEVNPGPQASPPERDPDERARIETKCGHERGGTQGDPISARTDHRYGVMGPRDNPDPHVAHSLGHGPNALVILASIGFPRPHDDDAKAPVAPWGRDESYGNDEASARAALFGALIGSSFGSIGIGIGKHRLCDTCGDAGRGVAHHDRTGRAGETVTESTLVAMAMR